MTSTSQTGAVPPEHGLLGEALVSGARPERPGPLSASLTFAWRALLRIRHVPEQLFDVTMFPIMFLLMFTYLFGGALAGSPTAYLQGLLPGILVMTVVMITMYTGMDLNNDIGKGVFDRFRSMPVWRPSALVGALLADSVRYTLASVMTIVLGLLLGFRPGAGLLGMVLGVALLLLFCFALSWAWTALGLVLRSPQSVVQVSMMILFPFTFISNVFVDPATMPGWLQGVVGVNPITHLVTAVRGLMHGEASLRAIGLVLLWSAGFVSVFGPLTMRLYGNER